MRTSRFVFASATAALALVSLRPDARVLSALDWALAPVRVLAEVASPLGFARARSASAAQRALDEREAGDLDLRRELRLAERLAALPDDGALLAGRRFVHAEVARRREGHFDQLVIAPDGASCEGLARGMPVAHGDAFVGRLIEVDSPRRGEAVVELATSRDFAVGASVAEADGEAPFARLVVGGLADLPRGAVLALAARAPSRRDVRSGLVRTEEPEGTLDPFAREASGFALGTLFELASGELAVAPPIDYRGGLFDVVVVAPADVARAPDAAGDAELFDGRWRAVRTLGRGDPSAAREGFKIAAGTLDGALAGAAVVRGVRWLGVTVRAGALASDVATLGDPGLTLPIVARVEGVEKPLALGRLVSLGRGARTDVVRMRWDAAVELVARAGAPGPRRARLFTGAGEPLVPRGLFVGEATLPDGPGPHVIEVEQQVDTRDIGRVFLRVAAAKAQP
jgi:hypothetical protein